MLITDFYTLETVYSLNLTEHVILNSTNTLDSQDIVWVYTTFCQLITSFKYLSVCDLDTGSIRDQVSLGVAVFRIGNNDLTFFLGIVDNCNTRDFCDDSKTLRFSCLKKLLNSRKTLCDISTGYTTTMECTHGKLCTRLTDRLCCDDTNRFSNLNSFTSCHICTVTFSADTNLALTGQDRTDLNFFDRTTVSVYTLTHDTCCTSWCDHMVCFNKNFTIFVCDGLAGETSCDTFLKVLDLFLAIHEAFDIHTRDLRSVFTAVCFTNDKFLRYVNHSSGQVTRVGCTKSGIGHTFTSSMRGHEVFQYFKTFTEV